jgi:signal transduction histidine kinase
VRIFRPVTGQHARAPVNIGESAIRELMVVREIADAFLNAERADDALQFALQRVVPLVGASFASVYLIDDGEELMRLAAAHDWPERFRPFLGEMRVRLGRGPSGQAAAEGRPVRVRNVLAASELAEWHDVAREIGFEALIALPLRTPRRTLGVLTFYFAEAGAFPEEEEQLLRIVADQMAGSVEKSAIIEQLRRTNASLLENNAELERQYSAALEARRLKEEFLSNISHELRTPLTSVLGYTYLLQEGLSGPLTGEQRSTIAHVTSASEQLLALIEDLLELAALKRGDFHVKSEEFDVRDAVHDAVAAAHAPPDGVELVLDLPPEPARMLSDRGKVTKVLVNLIANAYKFTAHGEVRVAVQAGRGKLRLRVSDTGIGIPPEAQRYVFDEFRQADGSPTRRYSGSGLGLALARQFTRMLGGELTLVSEQGRGSEFTAELPLLYTSRAAGAKLQSVSAERTAAEAQ